LDIGRKFTEKTGHPVFVELEGASDATYEKIRANWPNVGIDVFFAAPVPMLKATSDGFTVPLTPDKIPNMANYRPFAQKEGTPHGIINEYVNYIIAYRKDIVTTPITKIADFYRPDLKGKLTIMSPHYVPGSLFTTFALSRGGDEKNWQPGVDALIDLAKTGNIGSVYESESVLIRNLVSGDFPVGIGEAGLIGQAASQNANVVALKHWDDGKVYTDGEGIVVIDTPRKDIALDFVNLYLDTENNQHHVDLTGYPSTNSQTHLSASAATYILTADEVQKYGYWPDDEVIVANQDAWLKAWETQIAPLMSK
jgi:putative spermidine/putrescine transport system substrate-binding protein